MSKQNSGQSKESTQTKAFTNLVKSEDFKSFLIFATATATIPQDVNLDEISEKEQKEIIVGFKQWVKAGKPAATNPLENQEPEKIIRVSRIKAYGKQFLTAIISGVDIPYGIRLVPIYRKFKHPQTGKTVEDRTMVVSHRSEYTTKYTDKKARELVERCIEECETPQLTFKVGGWTTPINNPHNFTKDFDQVLKDSKAGIQI